MNLDNKDCFDDDYRLKYTGSQINYYFVCQRKLWLSSHNIELESESDQVLMGKLLHENSYKREQLKEIELERIKIDIINRKANEIHEIKKSKKMEKAHEYQLLYYLYFLKKKVKINVIGIIDYPLLKKRVKIDLTYEKEKLLESILDEIGKIIKNEIPPEPEWKSYCRHCAYKELCWG